MNGNPVFLRSRERNIKMFHNKHIVLSKKTIVKIHQI